MFTPQQGSIYPPPIGTMGLPLPGHRESVPFLACAPRPGPSAQPLLWPHHWRLVPGPPPHLLLSEGPGQRGHRGRGKSSVWQQQNPTSWMKSQAVARRLEWQAGCTGQEMSEPSRGQVQRPSARARRTQRRPLEAPEPSALWTHQEQPPTGLAWPGASWVLPYVGFPHPHSPRDPQRAPTWSWQTPGKVGLSLEKGGVNRDHSQIHRQGFLLSLDRGPCL